MTECVLCDWHYDPAGEAIAVYLPGEGTPLRWRPDGPAPCLWTDTLAETMPEVACVAHWSRAHPLQLRLALGRRDWELKPIGWQKPSPPYEQVEWLFPDSA